MSVENKAAFSYLGSELLLRGPFLKLMAFHMWKGGYRRQIRVSTTLKRANEYTNKAND